MTDRQGGNTPIAQLAKKRLAELKQTAVQDTNERLEDFIVRVSPELTKPVHLGEALDVLNGIVQGKATRMLWSVPPRHAKSYSVMHLAAQMIARNPKLRVAYITYSEDLSFKHSRKIRELCEAAGVTLSKAVRGAGYWMTEAGGEFTAAGIGGSLTGKGFDLVLLDDPHKSRPEVESVLLRTRVHDFYSSAIRNRAEPGASIVIIHTRWHSDDLIGHLYNSDIENINESTRTGWVYVNTPAINDNGEALWPARFPIEYLLKEKAANEYDFASLYQGSPRPRGGTVFSGTHFYDKLPDDRPTAEAIGLDLAYTAKSYADYSVAISGALIGDTIYVTSMRRRQCEPAQFAEEIRAEKFLHPRAVTKWFISGVEKGIVELLKSMGLHINAEIARTDKFVRAQAVATAWNNGKIKIPINAPWVETFVGEVLAFTGVGDVHDDIVDALAAMHNPLLGKRVELGLGKSRLVPF
jgi:predicted phage terminase large subunit-like protein